MTRQTLPVTIALCIAAAAISSGCQRPMGSASGPYSPAGSLSPASNPPLIPFGSLNGATRVPPPPTGSTQVSNGYDGQPAAMFSANPPAGGGAISSLAAGGSRTSLGGMPVIDLTAGMMDHGPPPAAIYSPVAPAGNNLAAGNSVAVGSGVATADWQTTNPNISVPPADLASRLRPLDAAQAASIMPLSAAQDYVPADAPSVAMTQYRSEGSNSPAWQAVQPASAEYVTGGNAFEQRSSTAAYASQLPAQPLPSTDPVQASPSKAAQNDTLLWRNPTVAK